MTTRRDFLKSTGAALGSTWLAAHWTEVLASGTKAAQSRDRAKAFAVLEPADAADLAAIAERIIPSTDTPGAREAGVVWFMDEALGGFMAEARDPVLAGLADLNRRVNAAGGDRRFADLEEESQNRLIGVIEAQPFFETVHFMTLAGMFAMPVYGGNLNHTGWDLIGFEHAHGWQPPFGYYDGLNNKDSGESR